MRETAGSAAAPAARLQKLTAWKFHGDVLFMTLARSNMECPADQLRLDAGEPDHLAPLLGFVRDELAEVGGRARKHRAAQIGKPRLHLGIGERGVDLPVELVDDLGGRVLGRADAEPRARLVARHEIAHGRDLGQRLRARRGRHRQRAQLAGPDVLDRRRSRCRTCTCTCPPMQIGERRRRAAIGHVHHVDAGHHLEQLAGHMDARCRCRPTPC